MEYALNDALSGLDRIAVLDARPRASWPAHPSSSVYRRAFIRIRRVAQPSPISRRPKSARPHSEGHSGRVLDRGINGWPLTPSRPRRPTKGTKKMSQKNRTGASVRRGQSDRRRGRRGDAPRRRCPRRAHPVIPAALSPRRGARGHSYPKGRIIGIFGPESSGKTTLPACHRQRAARGWARRFHRCGHAFDLRYTAPSASVGKLLMSQPDCGERAWTSPKP